MEKNDNIGVAILDTGIYRHIDFDNRIIAFKDFVNGRLSPYDDSGHGTHVVGIISGNGRASNGKYCGLDKRTKIICVKVLDKNGNGKIADVLKGIEWIKNNKEQYNIRIANVSFGTQDENDLDEDSILVKKVDELWDMGIVVIVAAGNNGPRPYSITVPGISRKVITVGAYDDTEYKDENGKVIKNYSGRGPTRNCIVKPEIVAPGSDIVSCLNSKNGYSVKSGTSMATPIVSGAIALLLEKYPELTPKDVKMKIYKCTKKLNIPKNQQGWGLLDVEKLLE